MILPQSKRVVRFDAFPGKTVGEVVENSVSSRLIFTDGTFADIEAEDPIAAKIVLDKGKPGRLESRRLRRERNSSWQTMPSDPLALIGSVFDKTAAVSVP